MEPQRGRSKEYVSVSSIVGPRWCGVPAAPTGITARPPEAVTPLSIAWGTG